MLFTLVNPEMENDYSVFAVNYVYCFYTGTVLILLKLQFTLQILRLNSSLLSTWVGGCIFAFFSVGLPKKQ